MTDKTLLTLICNPSLERTVTDWLLDQEDIIGFTSMPVYGHGSDPESLNLTEQVRGSRKQVMFQIQLNSGRARIAIIDLKHDLQGADIYYWLVPIIDAGQL